MSNCTSIDEIASSMPWPRMSAVRYRPTAWPASWIAVILNSFSRLRLDCTSLLTVWSQRFSRSRPRALITSPSGAGRGFSQTMAHLTWRAIWPSGSRTKASSMCAGHPIIRKPRARSSAGTSTLKNRILFDNYYLPGDLERQISAFVEHYNHVRYHESLSNLTPADVYFGRADTILAERERIKRATINTRRLQHQLQAA